MKDEYLISYKLFCQRKKFRLYNFLTKNFMSYEEIQDFFRKKSVTPPDKDFYDSIVDKISAEKERAEKIKKIQTDSKITVGSKVCKEKENLEEGIPKKRKRRRSKKSE